MARDIAVIDVGSNSVRLVQFRLEQGALWPVFNEKTMAGLGKGANLTGRLNPEGVASALRALKRFRVLLDAKQVLDRRVVATAAVRWCEDGPDFVERVRAETGLEIEVLTGQEEGRRSALGVLGGTGGAIGLTGDLGGSSLELTPLQGHDLGEAVSLPLGPLSLDYTDLSAAQRKAKDVLERSGGIRPGRVETFYAVGGAWRAFAQIAMALHDYPLQLLHMYELSASQIARAAHLVMQQSEASLQSVPGLSYRRVPTLPYAAMLLQTLVEYGGFKRVVFSAHGLREGVVCDIEPSLVTDEDPLLAGADALARGAAVETGLGPALAAWIEPVFEAEPEVFGKNQDKRLRAAASRLSDTGARMHPDHRGDLAMTQALYAPFGGVTHFERAFLALAVHHRYEGRKTRRAACPARQLASEESQQAALKLGLALRLGAALSGRSAKILSDFTLLREGQELVLKIGEGDRDLAVERALHRFEQLADALRLTARVD